jgi:error-prone DNA polymerase
MGTFNPIVPWSELERRLSGRSGAPGGRPSLTGEGRPVARRAASPLHRPGHVEYAELHCHSSFSFLDGASSPEELVAEAVRLELEVLALTDHDGCYGVVRFAEAARESGLRTVFGAELSLPVGGATRAGARAGAITPVANHLLVLAEGPEGYAALSAAIARAHLAGGEKGRPAFSLVELSGAHGGHWRVLTGCRNAAVPRALEQEGPSAAARELARLVEAFGAEHVVVELFDEGGPLDSARNDALAQLAARAGLRLVATTNAHYATPRRYPLATALAAIRARSSLEQVEGYLPAWGGASLRSGAEQSRRFARYPGVVAEAAALGRECAFDLRLIAPGLPPFPTGPGEREIDLLRRITEEGACRRYGPPGAERVSGARRQIARELEIIEALNFPGYFLVVWDVVEFCRRERIYCQGRGSAANSAVCFALGITNADAVALGLLFERFLSPAREGPPDIDLDIESGRRDEVIAYVYARYGREHAAQVANVITYRPRSAVRDVGRALGYPPSAADEWSRSIGTHFVARVPNAPGEGGEMGIPAEVLSLAAELEDYPRHLGIHSGGMVICDRPVIEVCPVEWARRAGRSVLQWDKEDCAIAGLVKFDLLGLGMLEALHRMVDLIGSYHGTEVDLALIEQEDAVYEMLSRGDSMGVFQVESRAQMATLPRLRPRCFYDLVVEVALIRPGPIQGGSVHPYLRRRNGEEPVTYLHPLLRPALAKTLGVPLFQEQLMQIAIDVAGFSATEADQLRQAMGSKRSRDKMERLRGRLYEGMGARGVSGEVADAIFDQLAAFANYGFPESHSVSFAYLVYSSAWLKLHYPAAFLVGLLNSQPMGFWSPQSLVADARRHGVVVHGTDALRSGVLATLEGTLSAPEVRLGLASVRGVGEALAERIVAARPFGSVEELANRSGASRAQLESLATAGALGALGVLEGDEHPIGGSRREALWAAGALAGGAGRLPGMVGGACPPALSEMTLLEQSAADLWSTGVDIGAHPMSHVRAELTARKVRPAASLYGPGEEGRVLVAGIVTHRQRPSTAGGTVFLNLEDESGVVNVICSRGLWVRYREEASAPALLVRGRLERAGAGGEAVTVVAERLEALDLQLVLSRSRDFR